MLPFGFEQLSNTAEGAQADPDSALHARIDGADAGVFLAGGEGVVVAFQAGEDVAQLADFVRGEEAVPLFFIVVVEQLVYVYQVGWVAVGHQGAPWLAFLGPAQHLANVVVADHDGAVQAAGLDRAQDGEQIFLGEVAQRLLANERQHVFGEATAQLGVAVLAGYAVVHPLFEEVGDCLVLRGLALCFGNGGGNGGLGFDLGGLAGGGGIYAFGDGRSDFVALGTDLRQRFLGPTAQAVIALGSIELELVAKQDGDAAYPRTHLGDQAAVFAQRLAVIGRGERLQLLRRQFCHFLPLA